ncbi:sporulation protein YpjB [Sporolactobacillus shoreicorticis]|uniref:Sporulation protein YpjB n=1 Tax=Sporolactobacillus shoreicorticis TaxID=1923877 RepID=A0ABW5S1X4_9BACL|nr:sporulation protein YpjB [Sporolactobacillus shoreicorticis]MCO7127024.1 sporulation protein YpjB [Sporolactobacillus shoreicorticis]
MNAKLFAIFISFILFIGFPVQGRAEKDIQAAKDHTEELINLSDRVFQYTDANQDTAAFSLLNELSKEWDRSPQNYSDKDQRVINTAIAKLKILMANSGEDQREVTDAAVSLRLSFDALAPNGKPLWKNLHSEVVASVSKMKSAVKKKDHQRFQYYLNEFLDKYAVVYPAMVIDGQSDAVSLVNKQINTLADQRDKSLKTNVRIQQLTMIEHELNDVFDQSLKNNEESMVGLATVIGGIIVCVLAYTSWRRYVGERLRREHIR